MKKYSLALVILPSLLFAACLPANTPPAKAPDAMMKKTTEVMEKNDAMMQKGDAMEKKDAMMEKDEGMMKKEGAYIDNSSALLADTVLTDGATKVLFFHASWCPTCKAGDATLTSWYTAGGEMVTTYKINYDTEKMLAQKYGVTYQHTFVKVDGQGNMIEKIQGPSNDQLEALLKS